MSIEFGNASSEFLFLFLPGWTLQPSDMFDILSNIVNEDDHWCILNQTFRGHEWFEYDSVVDGNTKNYDSYVSFLNLNYKEKSQLDETINYVYNAVSKINKKVVLLGTSQGATVAFHYFHSHVRSENVVGLWLHNMAGFYPELLDRTKKYKYFIYNDTKTENRHSVFDDDVINHMNRSLSALKKRIKNKVFFYNSINDDVVPGKFKNIMMKKISSIYDFY